MSATEPEIIKPSENATSLNKFKLLGLSLLFDTIGMLSFMVPGIGEFSDVIWAPISAFIIYKMFKGTEGKIGGIVSFLEELIPGLDIIPTFTLTWIYKFVLKKGKDV